MHDLNKLSVCGGGGTTVAVVLGFVDCDCLGRRRGRAGCCSGEVLLWLLLGAFLPLTRLLLGEELGVVRPRLCVDCRR